MKKSTYDYISLRDSEKEARVVISYAEPQNNARTVEYIYEKAFGKCSKLTTTIYGEQLSETINLAEFYCNFGRVCGEMAAKIPKE